MVAMSFLDLFDVYAFLVRDSVVLVLVCLSIYVMFNAGLFAVPQIGFMAVGAYTAAILSNDLGVPLVVTLPASLLSGAVCGLLLGGVLARLNGVYLAIATIGFSEMVRVTIRNLDITGGPVGLAGIERSLDDMVVVGVPLAVVIGLLLVNRTRHGGAFTAMREDSLMAAHQGVNVRRYRTILFVVSGALAGLAGGMQVHLNGFVEPSGFSFQLLVLLLTAVIIGGMTRVAGPLLGALVVFGLGEVLRDFASYRNMLNGALIVAVVAFAPEGISAPLQAWVRKALARVRPAAGPRREPPDVDRRALAHRARADDVAAVGQPLLEVRDLAKHFGGVTALDGVDLTMHRGEIVGLIGPNGSGKTTFLNLLSGVYVPDRGTGTFDRRSLESSWGRPAAMTKAGLARTFQNIRLVDGLSVAENVRMGAYLEERRTLVKALVDEALERVGLTKFSATDVGVLPYGLRRKVEIARALVRGPELLLLDEPTAGMSPAERDEIFDLVQTIRADGVGVLVVEHDIGSMTRHCDRVCVLNFGKQLAVGEPAEVLAEEAVIDAYIGRTVRA
jgi:branched-chain amino acid transport system permease protein